MPAMTDAFTDPSLDLVRFVHEFGPYIRKTESAAADGCLGAAEARVLLAIVQTGPFRSQVVKALGMDSGQFARICAKLRTKGLIEPSELSNARRSLLVLTGEGIRLASERAQRQAKAASEVFQGMSEFERERFLGSVKILSENLVSGCGEIEIRDAVVGETGSILHHAVNLFGNGFLRHDPEKVAQQLHGYFLQPLGQSRYTLVAVGQRHLVGAISVSCDKGARCAAIDFFGVFDISLWGYGFGRQLLEHAVTRCRNSGVGRITAEFPVYDQDARYLSDFSGWKLASSREQELYGWTGPVERWEKVL